MHTQSSQCFYFILPMFTYRNNNGRTERTNVEKGEEEEEENVPKKRRQNSNASCVRLYVQLCHCVRR